MFDTYYEIVDDKWVIESPFYDPCEAEVYIKKILKKWNFEWDLKLVEVHWIRH